ncbi:phosphoglycerate mutase [Colletotrichum tofieldiae]|nr:phosphoglycerate mutase [Colletotrichum tofieldiae]GKT68824.1 phosphoglycerate mutase [Colletotrichum tofieldiae]GKT88598.1 phosphoglycerate mutase [Colletotrichum tofieldiae]
MGVGKTITYQAVTAVRRLARISQLHAAAHPEMHRARGESRGCALRGRPFGIQCACETDGLTARFLQKFPEGATLIVALSSVAPQAVKDAAAYFSSVVTIHLPSDDPSKPGSTETSEFIEIVDFKNRASGKRAEVAAARASCAYTMKTGLPTKTRVGQQYAEWETEGLELLKTGGVNLTMTPPSVDATKLVLVVGQQRVSIDKSWRKLWTEMVKLPIRNGKQAKVVVGGAYFFGLIVWDEAHQVRGLKTTTANVLWEILERQSRPPMVVLATGSPITSGFKDLALMLSMIRNRPGKRQALSIQADLADLDTKTAGGGEENGALGKDVIAECARFLGRDIIKRDPSSLFFGHPIMDRKAVVTERVECPIDPQFRDTMDRLVAKVGTAVVQKLQAARAVDGDGGDGDDDAAPHRSKSKQKTTARADGDMAIISKSREVRQLDLATHLPGLLRVWETTQIETRWTDIVGVIGSGKGLLMPPTYLDETRVPPGIWNSLNDILVECSRTASLLDICTKAFHDGQVYPDDAECGPGFGGPKNVVVFTKWPVLAYLVQLWFETKRDARFRTALVHSGVPGEERQKIIDWFREFNEPRAGAVGEYEPKRHTKVFITTYAVSSTGLDALKVANYCVHFGVIKNVNEERQATGRVDRQGQPLESFVYYLQSMAEPLDQLTAWMRDKRSALFGEGGLLEEVVRLFQPQC